MFGVLDDDVDRPDARFFDLEPSDVVPRGLRANSTLGRLASPPVLKVLRRPLSLRRARWHRRHAYGLGPRKLECRR